MTSSPRAYKGFTPRQGIYRARHHRTGRTLLGASTHLVGSLGRLRFQLDLGNHPHRQLQQDWQADGPDGFTFEVLDELQPRQPGEDLTAELEDLLELWREKLGVWPGDGY